MLLYLSHSGHKNHFGWLAEKQDGSCPTAQCCIKHHWGSWKTKFRSVTPLKRWPLVSRFGWFIYVCVYIYAYIIDIHTNGKTHVLFLSIVAFKRLKKKKKKNLKKQNKSVKTLWPKVKISLDVILKNSHTLSQTITFNFRSLPPEKSHSVTQQRPFQVGSKQLFWHIWRSEGDPPRDQRWRMGGCVCCGTCLQEVVVWRSQPTSSRNWSSIETDEEWAGAFLLSAISCDCEAC